MPATRTPSQRAKANGDRGKRAERDVVAAFLAAGFPDARRAVATGIRAGDRVVADPGDVAGIPRTVVSVKDCATERLPAWIAELDAMALGAGADYALLVVKRRGHADPNRWWCWMTWRQLANLLWAPAADVPLATSLDGLVRAELGDVLPLLRREVDGTEAGAA